MARLSYDTRLDGDLAVIALSGELDLSGAAQLEQELDRLLADSGPTRLVVDLRRLDFLDSSGLRMLVLADQRSRGAGRRFALVPGAETVQRVFDITRMTERLTFVSDPAELRTDAEASARPGEG